ncbi:DNA-directed RNA polymerase II subunit RPB1 [Balaenoptera ricei]|uniref:DNA-directed RNA polymerase II subunit RPB1 n=1 Tax=Balaenoptera ricei TaxID=2746895 RepID=UPI0028BE29CA|nr:DNA-directed RNA polymerase II subunit RPB1 [Balaenoptera ricei]
MSASEETGPMSFSTPEGSPSLDSPNDGLDSSSLSGSGRDSSLGTLQVEFPSFPRATTPASPLPLPHDFDFPFPPKEHRGQSRDSMDSTPTSSLVVSSLSPGFSIMYHMFVPSSPSPSCPALRDSPPARSYSPPTNPRRPRREKEASPQGNTGACHTSQISSAGSPLGSPSALSYSSISISSVGSPLGSQVAHGCSLNTPPRPQRETEASPRSPIGAWHTSPISSAGSPVGSPSALSYSPISTSYAGWSLGSPSALSYSPISISSAGSPLGSPSALSYSPISVSSAGSTLGSHVGPGCSPNTPPRPWRETEASHQGPTAAWHTSPISSAGSPLGSPSDLSYSPISISSVRSPLGSPSALSYSPISVSSAGSTLGSHVGPGCSPNTPPRPWRETEASPRGPTAAWHTSPISSAATPLGSASALSYSPISISCAESPLASPVAPGSSPQWGTESSPRGTTNPWQTSPISSTGSPLGSPTGPWDSLVAPRSSPTTPKFLPELAWAKGRAHRSLGLACFSTAAVTVTHLPVEETFVHPEGTHTLALHLAIVTHWLSRENGLKAVLSTLALIGGTLSHSHSQGHTASTPSLLVSLWATLQTAHEAAQRNPVCPSGQPAQGAILPPAPPDTLLAAAANLK